MTSVCEIAKLGVLEDHIHMRMNSETAASSPPCNDPNLTLEFVMMTWPETVKVFIRHRMHCVGCPIRRFYTIEDACRVHGIVKSAFLADLNRTIIKTRASH